MKEKTFKRIFIALVFLVIVFLALWYTNSFGNISGVGSLKHVEGFDATGYVYNVPPEWFRKPEYNLKDWLVNVYPDRIQPSCLPYSVENKYNQPLGMLNYWSQAQQFWRF